MFRQTVERKGESRYAGSDVSWIPLSMILGLILFDQIFAFQPVHGHIMNLLVVDIHGLV